MRWPDSTVGPSHGPRECTVTQGAPVCHLQTLFILQQPRDSFPRGSPWGPAHSRPPHLCAGGPSMMMLTQRICMALRGLGRLHTVDRVMRLRAAMLLLGTGDRHLVNACTRCSTQRVRRKVCLCLRAQLEADKVLDVVEDALAFLHCAPERKARAFVGKRSGDGAAT